VTQLLRRLAKGKAAAAALDITGDTFHPEWNYTIKPRRR
jgi:hypothetical protein